MRTFLLVIVAFTLGGVTSWWLWRPAAAEEKPASLVTRSVAAEVDELQRLREENRGLHAERVSAVKEAQHQVQMTAERDRRERLQSLVEANRRQHHVHALSPIGNGGQINELFAFVFDLTPDERRTLADIVKTSQSALERLEKERAKVARKSATEVELSIDPFPQEGGRVYDQALARIATTLGPERNNAFLELSAPLFEAGLSGFGARSRTITITYEPQSSAPYKVKDFSKMPGGHSTSTGQHLNEDFLKQGLGHLGEVMPRLP